MASGEKLNSIEKVVAWAEATLRITDPPSLLTAFRNHSDPEYWWKWRELMRHPKAPYYLPWFGHVDNLITSCERQQFGTHLIHISETDPARIAYTPSNEYGRADRQVVTSVGKYLTKYFLNSLGAETIRDAADAHRAVFAPGPVYFAFGADEIQRVYLEGPGSCMSHEPEAWEDTPEHPVRIYDGPDVAIAYMKADDGRITARTLVRIEEPLSYIRVYGDGTALVARLKRMGFQEADSLGGMRLRYVSAPDDHDGALCPYLDGISSVRIKGSFLVPTHGGEWDAQTTGGWAGYDAEQDDTDTHYCSCCDNPTYEGDGIFDYNDNFVCDGCRADCYYLAIVDRHGHEAWVHEDRVILINDVAYHNSTSLLQSHGFVLALNDEWIAEEDAFCFPDGSYCPSDEVVELHDGSSGWCEDNILELHDGRFARGEDATQLSDGTYALNWEIFTTEDGTKTLAQHGLIEEAA